MEVQVLFRPLVIVLARVLYILIYSMREFYAAVIQLARMPPCHGGCRGFESHPPLSSNDLNNIVLDIDFIFKEALDEN